MTPEQIKEIIEKAIANENYWIYILISAVLSLLIAFGLEKSKNYATRTDITDITQKIEDVKAEIQNNQEIEKQKRELKYNAILKSLELIDARLSNFIIDDKIIKQYATTKETRECHSRLILTCDSSEIIESFEIIMMTPLPTDETGTEVVMKELGNYRDLVREELGFGEPIKTNQNLNWITNVPYEEK